MAGGYNNNSYETLISCEKYNLNRNKWHQCEHYLPYPLHSTSVVVSANDNFAVITGGRKEDWNVSDKVIIFSEDKGFETFEPFSLRSKRHNHLSIRIQ